MTIFERYASYYDLIYKEKSYQAETEYVHRLIQQFAPGSREILELGCGTGRHARQLAELSYEVIGIDQSEVMLKLARERFSGADERSVTLVKGDIRSLDLGKKVDVVISLFHVMSYQVTNEDLKKAFAAASRHLETGGVFIFDCWYGPAVLTDRPAVRIKRMEDDAIRVTRIAEPAMDPEKNRVEVKYDIFVEDKVRGGIENFSETHNMRYLFDSEISELLEGSGMKREHSEEWLTGKPLSFASWSACYVGKKG
jgi:SAM-dependent methyltransferase